jgi:hypothetical protein
MQLIRETIVTQFMPPSMTAYNYGSGPHKIEIPQSSVSIAKPVSYEFRVAEYINDNKEVVKVGLQVRMWEHSNITNGDGFIKQDWKDVERVQIPIGN